MAMPSADSSTGCLSRRQTRRVGTCGSSIAMFSNSSVYIAEPAGIPLVHWNPFQKLTAFDPKQISFPDAAHQSVDEIKYETKHKTKP